VARVFASDPDFRGANGQGLSAYGHVGTLEVWHGTPPNNVDVRTSYTRVGPPVRMSRVKPTINQGHPRILVGDSRADRGNPFTTTSTELHTYRVAPHGFAVSGADWVKGNPNGGDPTRHGYPNGNACYMFTDFHAEAPAPHDAWNSLPHVPVP